MKNKIILATILIMGIMGTSLTIQAAGSGLELLWTWNEERVESLFVEGNKAYIGSNKRFLILEISDRFAPRKLSEMPLTSHVPSIYVSGKYAYVVDTNSFWSEPEPDTGLRIIDISNPHNPRQVGFYSNYSPDNTTDEPVFYSIFVSGKLAYLGSIRNSLASCWGNLEILDIANPASPKLKGSLSSKGINDIYVSGNYAYCSFVDQGGVWSWGSLMLIDISNPETPLEKSSINYGVGKWSNSVYFANGYVYMSSYENAGHGPMGSFEIIDVTDPADLKRQYSYRTKGTARDAYVAGNSAFIADGKAGVSVLNFSNLNEIVEVAYYETPGEATKVFVNNFVYVVDDSAGLLIFKITTPLIELIKLKLDKTELKFGATQNISTPAQDVWVHNEGIGTLHWNATSDTGWLTVSPQAGEGNGTISVKVKPAGLSAGIYDGIVTITDPQAYNGPQVVNVTLKVFPNDSVPPPFGYIDTPIDGSSVMNNIPVTGWVLHDIGVKSVKIYREDGWDEGKTPVCIGNAFFLAGSRPDIETAYPDYPSSEKAGWGYMVLTNLFPGGGNGQFTLHAVAQTLDGQHVTLGTKKII
ncbi:MAG TPA: hypothetical protein VK469_19605, partial [Candidatus Kapabacteria bacterium]|nr:hypothetical protein [Candidatus Kapabacteria bacterium]